MLSLCHSKFQGETRDFEGFGDGVAERITHQVYYILYIYVPWSVQHAPRRLREASHCQEQAFIQNDEIGKNMNIFMLYDSPGQGLFQIKRAHLV